MDFFRQYRLGYAKILYIFFASLLPGMVAAQESYDFDRPGIYTGLGGTYGFHWFYGKAFDDNLGGRGVQVLSSSSWGLNTRAGDRVNSWFAAELEYEWMDGFTNKIDGKNVATLTSHQITLNGKFIYPDWGRFQPYGLLGIGLSIWETNDRRAEGSGLSPSSLGLAGRVGLGIDAYVTENVLVNLEIDMALSTTRIHNSNGGTLDNLFYIPIQFGVQYRF